MKKKWTRKRKRTPRRLIGNVLHASRPARSRPSRRCSECVDSPAGANARARTRQARAATLPACVRRRVVVDANGGSGGPLLTKNSRAASILLPAGATSLPRVYCGPQKGSPCPTPPLPLACTRAHAVCVYVRITHPLERLRWGERAGLEGFERSGNSEEEIAVVHSC